MTASAFEQLTRGHIDPDLLRQIAEGVAEVESELIHLTGSSVKLVQQVGRHTLRAGGKRLRPAFLAISAQATARPYDKARATRLAAAMEMIHMATLIHDDVIDESPIRRGQPTANHVFGNTESILAGDVFLSKAMAILGEDGDIEVIRTVSQSVVEVAEGEVKELELRGQFDVPESEHIEVLRLKTASFIRACCEVGAIIAGGSQETRDALRRYGLNVGLAFQIVDDVLDYRGKGLETGKSQAVDFREGQATLPLLRLQDRISDEERQVLRLKFGGGVTDDEIRMITGWMETRGVFESVERTAMEYIHRGREAVAALPDLPARRFLEAVSDYVVARKA